MHSHITKVLEWGFDSNHDFIASLWGCVLCDETSLVPFKDEDAVFIDHTACGPDCFGCKARGLQLSAGDAAGHIVNSGTTQKKWDKELDLYKSARAQGIQPDSTTTKKIQKAIDVSNRTGVAYDGSSPLRGIA